MNKLAVIALSGDVSSIEQRQSRTLFSADSMIEMIKCKSPSGFPGTDPRL